jgi:hypothetical protein
VSQTSNVIFPDPEKNNTNEIGLISVNNDIEDEEFKVINEFAINNNIPVYLNDYSLSLNLIPIFYRYMTLFPNITLIINENICEFFYNNDSNNNIVFGKSNVPLSYLFHNIKRFLRMLENVYEKMDYLIDDKVDLNLTSNIKNAFKNYFSEGGENLLNLFEKLNQIENKKEDAKLKFALKYNDTLSFDNNGKIIYVSQLNYILKREFYESQGMMNKTLNPDLNFNKIIEIFDFFQASLATLIFYNVFTFLKILEKEGGVYKIKLIVKFLTLIIFRVW